MPQYEYNVGRIYYNNRIELLRKLNELGRDGFEVSPLGTSDLTEGYYTECMFKREVTPPQEPQDGRWEALRKLVIYAYTILQRDLENLPDNVSELGREYFRGQKSAFSQVLEWIEKENINVNTP